MSYYSHAWDKLTVAMVAGACEVPTGDVALSPTNMRINDTAQVDFKVVVPNPPTKISSMEVKVSETLQSRSIL